MNLIFNGQDMSDYFKIIEFNRPPISEIDNIFTKLDGVDGAKFRDSRLEPYYFSIRVEVEAEKQFTIDDIFNEITEIFYTDNPEPVIFTDSPETIRYAKLENADEIENYGDFGVTTFYFICYDPFRYAREKTNIKDINNAYIYNRGALPVDFILEILSKSKLDRIDIKLVSSGEFIRINKTVYKNDKIKIDSKAREVFINDKIERTTVDFKSDFFQLPKGKAKISITGNNSSVLEFRERWL